MQIIVAGSGKLAQELLSSLNYENSHEVISWGNRENEVNRSAVVVHAGSGRELKDVISYCSKSGSTLVELATGSDIVNHALDFPVVLCPNTNILMLKFMAMLAKNGHYFKHYKKQLVESHQAGKSSTPGTAVSLAECLGIRQEEIVSVRNPAEQKENLKIPAEHLSRHAYHRIVIEESQSSITFETKVFGPAPYAQGLAQIISAIFSNKLENRLYNVVEFVENGWI
jgi:4-hydroxy-tetrahydrodipicolinate reductase